MKLAQAGLPRTNSRVPSMGSMIQRRPLARRLVGAFLAQQSVVGEGLFEGGGDEALAFAVGDR